MAAHGRNGQVDIDKDQQFSELRIQLFVLGTSIYRLLTLHDPAYQSQGLFRFSEALAWTSIFPYAYFMVQSFGERSKANTALLVGLLIAIFTFCEFLTGTLWAKVSDKLGRKPVLLVGVLGAMVSTTLFGLADSIYAAVAIRAFGGLANPNVGVVQTCIGEVVKSKDHQGDIHPLLHFLLLESNIDTDNGWLYSAKAFSIVPFLRGFGYVPSLSYLIYTCQNSLL